MLFPRFAARFMDSVITGIILFLVALAFGANSVSAITIMSIFVVAIYEIAFITLKGATPGKMLFPLSGCRGFNWNVPTVRFCCWDAIRPSLLSIIPFVGTVAYLGFAVFPFGG